MTTGFLGRAMRFFTALTTGNKRAPVVAFPTRYRANRQRGALFLLPCLALCAAFLHPLAAEDPAALPRFASLKADEVYMRVGPGKDYPVKWVYVRKDMPIQITDEKDVWRLVRDVDGEEGWIHRVMLSGTRTVIVAGAALATAHDRPDAASSPVFRAEPGVIAKLGPCEGGWCQVTVADTRGWMAMETLWGVDPRTVPE